VPHLGGGEILFVFPALAPDRRSPIADRRVRDRMRDLSSVAWSAICDLRLRAVRRACTTLAMLVLYMMRSIYACDIYLFSDIRRI